MRVICKNSFFSPEAADGALGSNNQGILRRTVGLRGSEISPSLHSITAHYGDTPTYSLGCERSKDVGSFERLSKGLVGDAGVNFGRCDVGNGPTKGDPTYPTVVFVHAEWPLSVPRLPKLDF